MFDPLPGGRLDRGSQRRWVRSRQRGGHGGQAAVAGAAVRVALGGVRGQRVRLWVRVRCVSADRDPRAARRAGRGVGAGRGGAGGGGGGGGAARPVGGVPPQAAGDGGDGPDPVRGDGERPGRVRARLAQLRPAARGVGHRRRGQDRLQRGQRRLPEGARAAGGPARRERAVRVHDLDRHRARPAARRGRDRVVRAGDDRAGRRGQLPALGGRDRRDRRARAAPRPERRAVRTRPASPGRPPGAARQRPARRVALHPGPPGAAPAVRQHDAGQRA